MSPILVAVVYAVVGMLVIPAVFALFRTEYEFSDVVWASVASALTSLAPVVGGPLSLVVLIAVLYWRLQQDLYPDIVVAVGAVRLAMVPALLLFKF